MHRRRADCVGRLAQRLARLDDPPALGANHDAHGHDRRLLVIDPDNDVAGRVTFDLDVIDGEKNVGDDVYVPGSCACDGLSASSVSAISLHQLLTSPNARTYPTRCL